MAEITITGMHCQACQSLIKMELEDAQIAEENYSFTQSSENESIIKFTDTLTADEIEKAKTIINAMEGYSIS